MLRGGFMSKSRRQFLTRTSLGLVAAAVAPGVLAADLNAVDSQQPTQPPPGAPPAFGTGPAVGPEVSPATFAEAEKLEQVHLTDAERRSTAERWRVNLASVYERHSCPLKDGAVPYDASVLSYISALPGERVGP